MGYDYTAFNPMATQSTTNICHFM